MSIVSTLKKQKQKSLIFVNELLREKAKSIEQYLLILMLVTRNLQRSDWRKSYTKLYTFRRYIVPVLLLPLHAKTKKFIIVLGLAQFEMSR